MDERFRLRERLNEYDLDRPDSKRRYNRRLFAAVSGRYVAATRLHSFGFDPMWKRRLVRLLPSLAEPDVLDLACGTGGLTFALARRYPRGRVVGMDLSKEMLRRARRRAVPANVRFRIADMNTIPFPDGAFDFVSGGYALRNAPEPVKALREVHRVLRPGGRAVFLEFSTSAFEPLRSFQLRTLGLWGSLWGALLHGNAEVYGYIAESLARFPNRREFDAMLRHCGFHLVRSRSLFLSLVRLTLWRR
jgi:demethylmenaquinone methyltransferase/2-methoxy-6-polyprenyl-1,4-benzoquinol methylase